MNDYRDPDGPENKGGSLLSDTGDEIKGMAKDGLHHPSTKPVLIGAGIGAVAGVILPVISVPIGLLAGAAFMLYRRVRP